MKKLWVSLLVLVTIIAISGCGGGGGKKDPAVETGTLEVKGLTDGSSTPLSGVSVKVIGGSKTYEGTTDDSGNVTINSIPVGAYLVSYTYKDYAVSYTLTTFTTSTVTQVTKMKVRPWADVKAYPIFDDKKINIWGQVAAADGATFVENVTVSVDPAPIELKYLYSPGGALDLSGKATDGSGIFFAVLTTGQKYTLKFSDGSHSFDPVEINVSEPGVFWPLTIKAK
jgi:hypothetical protein